MSSTIKVDLNDLIQKLKLIDEDGYSSVIVEIESDEYSNELRLSAQSIEDEEPIEYGTVAEETDDFM